MFCISAPTEQLCSETSCDCGYNHGSHEWLWDSTFETNCLKLDDTNLEVKFHPIFSGGTAAMRGNKIMSKGRHHYWEVKMLTHVYGTDVMVGVGTKKANLTGAQDNFLSLLGIDSESWGYSYRGYIQHAGKIKEYSSCFNRGNLVGVHLDTWKGTLQFFLDRKPLGIAFTGLKGLELYPMVSSTAAKSKMKITHSCSMPVSLQMECLSILSPIQKAYLTTAFPGLKYLSKSIFAVILQKHNIQEDDEDKDEDYKFISDNILSIVNCKRGRKRKVIKVTSEILK